MKIAPFAPEPRRRAPPMNFDRRKLAAFLEIAACGSIGRAAERLHLTQPGLSRLIAAMEARLGGPLFERRPTGMALSPLGTALLPRARHIVREMDDAALAIDLLRREPGRPARIGAVSALAGDYVPRALTRMLEIAPRFRIELVEGHDDVLLDALAKGEADLVLAGAPGKQSRFKSIGEIGSGDCWHPFSARGHPLGTTPRLAQTLEAEWVVSPAGSAPRRKFEAALRDAQAALPRIRVESSSPYAAIALVERTQMIGWLPRPLLEPALEAGRISLLDLPELCVGRRFHAICRTDGTLPEAAALFLKCLPPSLPPGSAARAHA